MARSHTRVTAALAEKAQTLTVMMREDIVARLNSAKIDIAFIQRHHQTLTPIGKKALEKIIMGIEDFKTQIVHSA